MLMRARPQLAERRKLDPRRRWRLLGLVTIVAAVGLSYALILKPNPFHHPRVVRAIFADKQGLSLIQRDVRVGGVLVGRIGDTRRVGDHAEIEMLIDKDIGEIYRDARASLRPHAPFEGTAFIDLDRGSPSAGPLGDRAIPLAHTRIYVPADLVLRVFGRGKTIRAWQSAIREMARAFSGEGAEGYDRFLANAPQLTRYTGMVARALQGPRGDELRTLIPAMSATADAFAGQNHLARIVQGAKRTLRGIDVDGGARLEEIIAEFPATLESGTRAGEAAVRISGRLRPLMEAIHPVLYELKRIVRPGTQLLRESRPILRLAAPIVANIRKALVAFGRQHRAIGTLFGAGLDIVKVAQQTLLPTLARETKLGLPTYLQLLGGIVGATGSVQAFSTPEQDVANLGSGHSVRGDLNLPFNLPLPENSLPIPCSSIAAIDPEAAKLVEAAALCTP